MDENKETILYSTAGAFTDQAKDILYGNGKQLNPANTDEKAFLMLNLIIENWPDDPLIKNTYTLIARCYIDGKGTEANEEKAYQMLVKAAEHGDELAYVYAADAFMDGIGVPQDHAKAFFWYRKSYDFDKNPRSAALLATMYYYGSGTEQDTKQAFKLALEASNKDSLAALIAAKCHAYGKGTKRDYTAALMDCRKALELNSENKDARELMQQLSANNGRSLKPVADLNKVFKEAASNVFGAIFGTILGAIFGSGSDD